MTTVQDLGRVGFQNLGIGISGALDSTALRVANLLVGNEPEAGGLEVLYLGPTFEIEADNVRMSFVGSAAAVEVLPDASAASGTRIASMRSVLVKRGEVVRVGSLTGGATLYVGIEGGLDIQPILGSVSTNIRGGTGGWQARAVVAGDRLPLCRMRASDRDECRAAGIAFRAPSRIRAIPGPQDDYFAAAEIGKFFGSEYTVQSGSDRVGMRLQGAAIQHAKGFNIASDATAPGSIQVPGNGQPIVLMADRQTIGGYPKIATVISADLPELGRLSIGSKIRFESVTVEAAQALRRDMLAYLAGLRDGIVSIDRASDDVGPLLFSHNLISGVVDAHVDGLANH
jgi:allophanate hydrolase